MLDVETVVGFGPEVEEEETVDDARDGEGEIVVFKEFGAEPEEENAGDGGDEDGKGDC